MTSDLAKSVVASLDSAMTIAHAYREDAVNDKGEVIDSEKYRCAVLVEELAREAKGWALSLQSCVEGFIAPELPRVCELCGKEAECRPYGPKGEQVCFECDMKPKKKGRKP
jgi:hypothetical protein